MKRSREAKTRKLAKPGGSTKPKTNAPPKRWLTVNQLCGEWGCTRATLYARHLPNMKTIMFGGRRRIEIADAEAYWNSLRQAPGALKGGRTSTRAAV